jgi:hypothetical protein
VIEAKSNTYSRECFDLFHVGNDEAPALREAAFIHAMRRLPEFQTIVDVAAAPARAPILIGTLFVF